MAEAWDREKHEAWLKDKPVEVSVVIASRSALRVLPMVAEALYSDHAERRAAIVLPCFRASVVARVAAVGPTVRQRVRNAFSAAAFSAAAFSAADAAAHAATWEQIGTEVEFLSQGENDESAWIARAADLNGQKLWHRGAPERIDRTWHDELRPHLLEADEGWQVWTEWYDAILAGDRFNEELEIARALIPDDDWEKGPAHVNAIIAGLIEEYTRKRTPLVRDIAISERSGDIEAKPAPRETKLDEKPPEEMPVRLKRWIERDMVRLRDDTGNQPFAILHPALDALDDVLGDGFHEEDWHHEIDGVRREIRVRKDGGELPRRAPELERFIATLDKAAFEIEDRYPRIARADAGRRAQNLRRLDEAEVAALEQVLAGFADVVDARLKAELGTDLEAIKADAIADSSVEEDALPIPDGDTKIRLYRLRGVVLRIRHLTKTGADKLRTIFDDASAVAKKIEQYRKASDTMDSLWEVLRGWFTGGGSGM